MAAFVTFALLGAIAGGLYMIAVLRWAPHPARAFAFGLVVAAAIYPVFALSAGAPPGWVAVELGGLAVFGAVALPALVSGRAPASAAALAALAAGWALHPLWDLLLHASAVGSFAGALGAGHVPAWYPPACATFDWAVAFGCAGLVWRARDSGLALRGPASSELP